MVQIRHMKETPSEHERWVVVDIINTKAEYKKVWLASFASELDAEHYMDQLDID